MLFQRGAVDGLNVVVPYREKNYYAMRPTIAIKPNEVIDLDGYFGLHPQVAAFGIASCMTRGTWPLSMRPAHRTRRGRTSTRRIIWRVGLRA